MPRAAEFRVSPSAGTAVQSGDSFRPTARNDLANPYAGSPRRVLAQAPAPFPIPGSCGDFQRAWRLHRHDPYASKRNTPHAPICPCFLHSAVAFGPAAQSMPRPRRTPPSWHAYRGGIVDCITYQRTCGRRPLQHLRQGARPARRGFRRRHRDPDVHVLCEFHRRHVSAAPTCRARTSRTLDPDGADMTGARA